MSMTSSNRTFSTYFVTRLLTYLPVQTLFLLYYIIVFLELNKLIKKLDNRDKRNVFKKERVESTWSKSTPPPNAPFWAVSSCYDQVSI